MMGRSAAAARIWRRWQRWIVSCFIFVIIISCSDGTAASAFPSPSSSSNDAIISLTARDAMMQGEMHLMCAQDTQYWYIANNNTLTRQLRAHTQSNAPETLMGHIAWSMITCFERRVCGIDTQGNIQCSDGLENVPLGHGFVSIGMAALWSCAVSATGVPSCWGIGVFVLQPSMVDPTDVYTNHRWRILLPDNDGICGLTLLDNTLKCYGSTQMIREWERYRNETSWISLHTNQRTFFCGQLANLTIRCWKTGEDAYIPVAWPAEDIPFHRIWLGETTICGHVANASDAIYCWGELSSGSAMPPSSFALIGSNVVDLACSNVICVSIVTRPSSSSTSASSSSLYPTSELIGWWVDSAWSRARPLPTLPIDLYNDIYEDAYIGYTFCARRSPHLWRSPETLEQEWRNGTWHCLPPQLPSLVDFPMVVLPIVNGVAQYAWSAGVVHARLLNGTIVSYNIAPKTETTLPFQVPPPSETFIDLCGGFGWACAIRTNGTIHCWSGVPISPVAQDADKPETGGAIHNDYVSITCSYASACALRQGGDVYCWGHNTDRPLIRGPWTQIIGGEGSFIGISATTQLLDCVFTDDAHCRDDMLVYFNTSERVARIAVAESMGCQISAPSSFAAAAVATIARDGTDTTGGILTCRKQGDASLPMARVDAQQIRLLYGDEQHLRIRYADGACVILDSQVVCSGHEFGVNRLRWGGDAMAPRRAMHRVIHIATNGSDTPFCGLKYFRPCATFNYAMTLIESVGPWTEFVFGEGLYRIASMSIDWTGITLRGTGKYEGPGGTGGTILMVSQRITVNQPSFRLINMRFENPFGASFSPLIINAGVMDVMLVDCTFVSMVDPLLIADSATVTMIRALFLNAYASSITVTNSQLTLIECAFKGSHSLSHLGSTPMVNAVNTVLTITNCSFDSMLIPGIGVQSGSVAIRDTQFIMCVNGALTLVGVQSASIHSSQFYYCGSAAAGVAIAATGTATVSTHDHDQKKASRRRRSLSSNPTTATASSSSNRHTSNDDNVNDGEDQFGGVIHAILSSVMIESCTWYDGGSWIGLTIHAIKVTQRSSVTIRDSTLERRNRDDDMMVDQPQLQQKDGAAAITHLIACVPSSTDDWSVLKLVNVTCAHNQAGCIQAAVCHIHIYESAIHDNTAIQGTFMSLLPHSRATIDGCRIEHNTAKRWGGAFYIETENVELNITNSVIVGNRAEQLGPVFAFTSYTTTSSLLVPSLWRPLLMNTTFIDNDATIASEPALISMISPPLVNHNSSRVVASPIVFRIADWFNTTFLDEGFGVAAAIVGIPNGNHTVTVSGDTTELIMNGEIKFDRVILTAPPGLHTGRLRLRMTATLLVDDQRPVTRMYEFTAGFRDCHAGEFTDTLLCSPCPLGRYSSLPLQSECSDCEIGRYQDSTGQQSCKPCARGHFQHETGLSFCALCATGTYTIDEGATDCAKCGDDHGLTCDHGQVRVNDNYWATPAYYDANKTDDEKEAPLHQPNRQHWQNTGNEMWNRRLSTTPCVRGRCIGGDDYGTADYEPCANHRLQFMNNTLCGACAPGYTEMLSQGCIPCNHPQVSMIIVAIIGLFIAVFVLHILAQSASGLPSIFFYFVQMAFMMLPTSESWLSWIGLFNGSAASTAFGVCIAPMTAGEQMILSITSILIFWCTLLIILSMQLCLAHMASCQHNIRGTCIAPARYWRSMIEIYLFSYSTIANTLIGYMSCVKIGNERVIFMEPTISCDTNSYKGWLALVIILFIVMIIIPPIAFIVHLSKNRYRFNESRFAARFGSLYEPFTTRSYWWKSFVLLRRVIFAVVDITLVILPSFKYMIFTFIHLLSLIIHILITPYATLLFNRIELATLISLTVLSLILNAFPDAATIAQYPVIQVLITITVITPMIGFFIYFLLSLRARHASYSHRTISASFKPLAAPELMAPSYSQDSINNDAYGGNGSSDHKADNDDGGHHHGVGINNSGGACSNSHPPDDHRRTLSNVTSNHSSRYSSANTQTSSSSSSSPPPTTATATATATTPLLSSIVAS